MSQQIEYRNTYGGLVIDRERCAYCAAWPAIPCALHRDVDHTPKAPTHPLRRLPSPDGLPPITFHLPERSAAA